MHLTLRQHYVPRTYLRAWHNSNEQVIVLDKSSGKKFSSSVENILLEKYYYEAPLQPPTNELEKRFGEYETKFGTTRDMIAFVIQSALSSGQDVPTALQGMLHALQNHIQTIKEFAAISYFRTPGALKTMQMDLQAEKDNQLAKEVLNSIDSAYTFNKQAFESSLLARFNSLHMVLMYSQTGLDTCDLPCYPLSGGTGHFNFAYDIGRHPVAFAAIALTPSLAVTFLPNLNGDKPFAIVKNMPKEFSTQLNGLVHTKADRWIVLAPQEQSKS